MHHRDAEDTEEGIPRSGLIQNRCFGSESPMFGCLAFGVFGFAPRHLCLWFETVGHCSIVMNHRHPPRIAPMAMSTTIE